jgi:putative heme transporter
MAARDRQRARTLVLEPVAFLYIVGGLLLSAAVFRLFEAAGPSITTIAIGVILGLALDPLVGSVRRRWGWSRARAAVLVMGGVFALVATLIVVMGPRAVDQARELSTDLPATVRQFYDLPVVGSWLEDRDAAGEVDEAVQTLPGRITDESISATVESLVGGALTALLVVTLAFAVLLDGEHLVHRVRRLLPVSWLDEADQVGRVVYLAIAQYFGGSLAVAALMGTVVLTLCLVFGVPLAPLAAVWAMLTDLIPQVGGFLGGALLGVLALTQGPFVLLAVVGLYVVYMNLENHVISPAIIGPAVDVTPPTTMLAALIGGAAAGVPGALVATPLAGALKQLYMQFRWGAEPHGAGGPGLVARLRGLVRRRRRKAAARQEKAEPESERSEGSAVDAPEGTRGA